MGNRIRNNKQAWEDLAELDTCWSILTYPKQKFGKWNIDEFFLTGKHEVISLLEYSRKINYPEKYERVLDFGCGMGRLSRYFAAKFQRYYGVDISKNMILKGRELNKDYPNCEFIINSQSDIRIFQDNFFDMIYCRLVLQHIPDKLIIKSYISEFMRVLKEKGLLVFQLPSYIPLTRRLRLTGHLYNFFKFIGFSKKLLYNKMKLSPMIMNFIPKKEVNQLLNKCNAKIIKIENSFCDARQTILSKTYYVTKNENSCIP